MKNRRRRWVLLGIALALLLLLGAYQFFAFVLKDQWRERDAAAAAAKSGAGLVTVTKAQKSVWDENSIYWVLTGVDKDGTQLMVWVKFLPGGKMAEGEGTVHAERVQSGVSEEEMSSRLRSELPDADIERLLPGVYNGEYAWQVFYREKSRYFYRFYRFSDGSAIGEGYSLPRK